MDIDVESGGGVAMENRKKNSWLVPPNLMVSIQPYTLLPSSSREGTPTNSTPASSDQTGQRYRRPSYHRRRSLSIERAQVQAQALQHPTGLSNGSSRDSSIIDLSLSSGPTASVSASGRTTADWSLGDCINHSLRYVDSHVSSITETTPYLEATADGDSTVDSGRGTPGLPGTIPLYNSGSGSGSSGSNPSMVSGEDSGALGNARRPQLTTMFVRRSPKIVPALEAVVNGCGMDRQVADNITRRKGF